MIIFLQKQMHIVCCNAINKHHYFRKECLSLPWSCDPVSLSFLHSITSPLFPNNGINDVIEASDGEVGFGYVCNVIPITSHPMLKYSCLIKCFSIPSLSLFPTKVYVTQWQPFSAPSQGNENPQTVQQKLQVNNKET